MICAIQPQIYMRKAGRMLRHKENLSAAVDAGKQAYRDAVTNFEGATGGDVI